MTQEAILPTSWQEFSKLERYALAPFMTHGQVCKTHDDLLGVLEIRTDRSDVAISQTDMDDLITEEADRYVVYRYIELLFLSKLISAKIVSWEYGKSRLQHNWYDIELLLVTDENQYEKKKEEVESPDYTWEDILVAYMPQNIISDMRTELEKIINKKNIGTKPPQHFVQESLATIPKEHTRTYAIQFATPTDTSSLATQLLEKWFKIRKVVGKNSKSPRK